MYVLYCIMLQVFFLSFHTNKNEINISLPHMCSLVIYQLQCYTENTHMDMTSGFDIISLSLFKTFSQINSDILNRNKKNLFISRDMSCSETKCRLYFIDFRKWYEGNKNGSKCKRKQNREMKEKKTFSWTKNFGFVSLNGETELKSFPKKRKEFYIHSQLHNFIIEYVSLFVDIPQ